MKGHVICVLLIHFVTIVALFDIIVGVSDDQNETNEPTCAIPYATPDKTYFIGGSGKDIVKVNDGSKVPVGTQIDFHCKKGYLFSNGNNSSTSLCIGRIGEWHPPIEPCLRFCPLLQTSNVDLKCKFNDQDIDCKGPMFVGTIVTPQCRHLHHVSSLDIFDLDYTNLQCEKDGRWSKELFTCDPDCGIQTPQTKYKDKEAVPGQFPWHVAIYSIRRNHLLICGGTLITTRVVLSAAHCFYNEIENIPDAAPTDYTVTVGKITRNFMYKDNEAQTSHEISEIIFTDEPYNPSMNGYTADIVMLILKKEVTVNPLVLPACYPTDTQDPGFNPGAGALGWFAGWGLTDDGRPSDILKSAQLMYMGSDECANKTILATQDKFCASEYRGSRLGLGDGGGGLVFQDPNNQRYYMRGIISTTERYSNKSITTFTDISYYQEWIDRIIEEKSAVSDHGTEVVDCVAILSLIAALPSVSDNSPEVVSTCSPEVVDCVSLDQELSHHIFIEETKNNFSVTSTKVINNTNILPSSIHQYLVSQLRYIFKKLNSSIEIKMTDYEQATLLSLQQLPSKLSDPLFVGDITNTNISFVHVRVCGMTKAVLNSQVDRYNLEKCRVTLNFSTKKLRISGNYSIFDNHSNENNSGVFVVDLRGVKIRTSDESDICYAPKFNKSSHAHVLEFYDSEEISYANAVIYYTGSRIISATNGFNMMIDRVLKSYIYAEIWQTLQPISRQKLLDATIKNVITRSISEFQSYIKIQERYNCFTIEKYEKKIKINDTEEVSLQNVHLNGFHGFNITKQEITTLFEKITLKLTAQVTHVNGSGDLVFSPNVRNDGVLVFEFYDLEIGITLRINQYQSSNSSRLEPVKVNMTASIINSNLSPRYPKMFSMPKNFILLKNLGPLIFDLLSSQIKSYIENIFLEADKL